jgi:hypothetical protein
MTRRLQLKDSSEFLGEIVLWVGADSISILPAAVASLRRAPPPGRIAPPVGGVSDGDDGEDERQLWEQYFRDRFIETSEFLERACELSQPARRRLLKRCLKAAEENGKRWFLEAADELAYSLGWPSSDGPEWDADEGRDGPGND